MLTISDKTEEYINTITHKLNDCNNNHNYHRPCRHHFPRWGWIVWVCQSSSAKWYEVVLNHLVYQYIVSPSERESFLWESRILSLLSTNLLNWRTGCSSRITRRRQSHFAHRREQTWRQERKMDGGKNDKSYSCTEKKQTAGCKCNKLLIVAAKGFSAVHSRTKCCP